jgi:hypothetical protein
MAWQLQLPDHQLPMQAAVAVQLNLVKPIEQAAQAVVVEVLDQVVQLQVELQTPVVVAVAQETMLVALQVVVVQEW